MGSIFDETEIVSKSDETRDLDASDMDIIARALALLLSERSRCFELAAEIARAKGEPSPNHKDFGLSTILRLSRRFSCLTICSIDSSNRCNPSWRAMKPT